MAAYKQFFSLCVTLFFSILATHLIMVTGAGFFKSVRKATV